MVLSSCETVVSVAATSEAVVPVSWTTSPSVKPLPRTTMSVPTGPVGGSALTSDAAVTAMQWWADILLKDKAAPTPADKQAMQAPPFALGKAAMFYAPPWNEP